MENTIQTEERSYIAFISYRHTPLDREAAEHVQKKIENYIVPKEFREQVGGKKLGLCFRDEDELPASSSLTDSIYYALDHSEFLIVICSPDLPLSKWCEAEIKYFLETHDRDHVLAVLADGEPSESFSPYMLHDFDGNGNITKDWEPLAANIAGPDHKINNKAFKKEIVRIYAALIGCPFDALWQRERRTRTNRLLTAAGAAVAVLAVFLGVVLNRNAQIAAANDQISAQNQQLVEKNDEIQKQNDQISDQNIQIESQNVELQRELSSSLVDSGINKLQKHDIYGAMADALSATESNDPAIYDFRAEKLLADSLGAYQVNKRQCSVVYEQSSAIIGLTVTDDEKYGLLLDSAGILRCLDLSDYSVLWETSTKDKNTRIYTRNQDDQILYRSKYGLFCCSIKDGALLWSYTHDELRENNFQAVSDDGTWFAILDRPNAGDWDDEDPLYLVFINTQDGSERGRVELSYEGYDLDESSYFSINHHGSDFSSDNSSFLMALPAREKTDDLFPTQVSILFTVDTETFESSLLNLYSSEIDRFYCLDLDASDNSAFIAGFSSAAKAMFTDLLTQKNGKYSSKDTYVDHDISSVAGANLVDFNYSVSACDYLINGDNLYIFSDNHMLVYDRSKNELLQHYALSGKVINAYWLNEKRGSAEIVCSDGYFIHYTFGNNRTSILSDIYGETAGEDNLVLACPINGGFSGNPDSGYTLAVSSDFPGALLLVKNISDPHGSLIDLKQKGLSNNIKFDFTPGFDTALYFYYDNNYDDYVLAFDKKTGEAKTPVSYENAYFSSYEKHIVRLDEDSFLIFNDQYNLDGTAEDFPESVASQKFPTWSTYNNLLLKDGSILSWNDHTPCKGVNDIEKDYPDLFPSDDYEHYLIRVGLNGTALPGTEDPETGLLYYNEPDMNLPISAAGKSGLLMTYGKPLYYNGDILTLEETPLFRFLDSKTGTITTMENRYPGSGNFITAFSDEKQYMAAVYDDGSVCIYDPANNNVMIPQKTWLSGEITACSFSPDGAYLLLLTTGGELDVIDTSSMEIVFDEVISLYDNWIRFLSTSYSVLDVNDNNVGDSLIVYAGNEAPYKSYYLGIVLNKETWTVTQEIGEAAAYDSDNEQVWAESDTKGVFLTYPLYTLSDLKAWAKEELENQGMNEEKTKSGKDQ